MEILIFLSFVICCISGFIMGRYSKKAWNKLIEQKKINKPKN